MQRLDVPAAAARAGVRIARVDFDWRVPLASPAYAALSDGERARAARFMRHEDAVRSAATRAALRDVPARPSASCRGRWRSSSMHRVGCRWTARIARRSTSTCRMRAIMR